PLGKLLAELSLLIPATVVSSRSPPFGAAGGCCSLSSELESLRTNCFLFLFEIFASFLSEVVCFCA
ncbi:hypothetical protein Dimus_035269, partial [Dionaea muscipula]